MKDKRTKISYDPQADVLSVENNAHARIDYAQDMATLAVPLSTKEEHVLVEILPASLLFTRQTK